MRKRILSAILSVVMIFGVLPAVVVVAEETQGYVKRTTSELGVNFIEVYEGYNQYAYWDYSQYTIGYGTRCEKDEYPAGISEPAAHALLKSVLSDYESPLNSFLKKNDIYLTQNQFDALVSFTYNMGGGVWSRDTTIARLLKKGDYTDKEIANALGLWVNAGGVKLQGLVERRAAEADYFCTDDFSYDKEVYVMNSAVNIRSGPSTSYSYVATAKKGSFVVVTEKRYVGSRCWGKITYNKKTCWVVLDYAKYANDQSTSSSLVATCLYKLENVSNGIALYWKKVNGATGYKIYKKEEGSTAYLLTETIKNKSTVSFVDTDVSEKQYNYYIIAYNSSKNATKSGVSRIEYITAPKLKSLSKLDNGFKLTWSKQSDATGYYVMRQNEDDNVFVKIASVGSDVTSYSDTTAVGGIKYYYTVKAVTQRGVSGGQTAKSGIYLSTPAISSATNTEKSITIKWTKSYNTTGYYVYRKASSESAEKKIATVKGADNTSYTDSTVKTGTSYKYYVKAYATSLTSKLSSALSTKIYTPPAVSSIKSASSGITLKWKETSGAKQYNIYRRASNVKTYTKIATVSTTSYVDKTATAGTKYYYRLTTVAGKSESYRGSAKSCSHFVATTIKSATATTKGLKISWSKMTGAVSYSVYKCSSTKNIFMKTVMTNSFTDTTLGSKTSRTYVVKVNYANGSSPVSEKFKGYKLATPKLKVESTSKGLLLSWTKVKNATGIIIYRKDPGSSSYKLYTKQDNYGKYTFENSTAVKGKKYSYKLKVIRGNSTSLASNAVTKTRS